MNTPKRRSATLSDASIFGFERMTASALSVAQANFQASTPPIRHLNVTGEILKMIRSHALKATIHSRLQDNPQAVAPVSRRPARA